MLHLQSGITVTNENFCLTVRHEFPAHIILSIPHDGLISPDLAGLLEPRTQGVRGRDRHVWPIAKDILLKCVSRGMSVSAVRLLMPRAYVDANRPLPKHEVYDPDVQGQTALEDHRLVSIYNHYHAQLANLVQASIATSGPRDVLLLDLHGFGKQPAMAPPSGYDLILGTGNRATIPHGDIDQLFAWRMQDCGYKVFLPGEKSVHPKGDPYSAGHITRYYSQKYGINAIQIEIAPWFRSKEGMAQGKTLAENIALFFAPAW